MKSLPLLGVAAAALWSCLGTGEAAIHSTIALTPPGPEVQIWWEVSPGLIYRVQYRSNIDTDGWIDRGPPVTAAGPVMCFTQPMGGPRRFYRVLGPDVVFIQPGTFTMGSPETEAEREPVGTDETQHEVTISRGFWMGRYEVTQGEYLDVVGSNPSYWRNGLTGEDFGGTGGLVTNELLHPVETVSWHDATNYCALLTERERAAGRLPADYVYRLPTEAEWEYACRAGATTRFSYGDDPGYTNLTDYAWYSLNSDYLLPPFLAS
jgi:formylglycine-generating enzyme required for sulfatase activity